MYYRKDEKKSNCEILRTVNMPGVQNVLKSDAGFFRRLFWFIVLVTSSSVCLYQGVNRLLLFISAPVEVIVQVERNETVKFPSFTVCPFDIDSMVGVRRAQLKFSDISRGKTEESVWYLLDFANITTEDLWQLNSIDGNNTKVEFRMKKTLPLTKPLSNITEKSSLAYLGTCMSITAAHTVDFMGPAFVLSIEQPVDDDVWYSHDYPAFTVYAHMDGVPIKHHAFFKGNIVTRKQNTAMALSATKFRKLNRSSHLCRDKVTAASCWTNCITNKILKNAVCRLPYMKARHLPKCNTSSESNATYQLTLNIYLSTKKAECGCPESCYEQTYHLDTDVQGYEENKTILHIFFPSNTFVVIEEKYSYDIVALVCDLGGNLGFYLGVSLLTILEIVELFWFQCRKLNVVRPSSVATITQK